MIDADPNRRRSAGGYRRCGAVRKQPRTLGPDGLTSHTRCGGTIPSSAPGTAPSLASLRGTASGDILYSARSVISKEFSSVHLVCPQGRNAPGWSRSKASLFYECPTIDLHCHWECLPVMDRMHAEAERLGKVSLTVGSDLTREVNKAHMQRIRPQMESVEVRLADMDEMGIDIQAVAHFPPQMYYWASDDVAEGAFRDDERGDGER